MNLIQPILLVLHIAAGGAALGTGILSIANKMFNFSHAWHVTTGRIFFWSMVVIFGTSIPLSLMTGNTFLLLIALFSFYLALAGWCYARNRRGTPTRLDWIRSLGMLCVSCLMLGYGGYMLVDGNSNGITMIVFAGIGGALSIKDIFHLKAGGVTGKERIGNHLSMMMGATIATITAFLVVNVQTNPAYLAWLAPTVVITPLIVYMNVKVKSA